MQARRTAAAGCVLGVVSLRAVHPLSAGAGWDYELAVEFFILIAGGLAAFRLSLLISKEDGPAYIFRRLRHLPPPDSSAQRGLSCEWCMSVWAGALVALYLWLIHRIPGNEWPLYWLAFSSLAIICNQQWTRGK